jgi:hypothetical protein
MTRALAVLAATLVAGCVMGRVDVSRVLTGPPGAPYQGAVAVVMEGGAPPPQYVEVGILQAIGYGNRADMANVVTALQADAQRLGCDAVIRVRVDQGYSQASGTGVCVRTPATWAAPPGAPPPGSPPPAVP